MFGWLVVAALAGELPTCVEASAEVTARDALAPHAPGDAELLARLVLAEWTSTGFPEDQDLPRALAWVVVNRVRLGVVSSWAARSYGRGVAGVVFHPGQFNPAISPRSRFRRDFLCPSDLARWEVAQAAAAAALAPGGDGGVVHPSTSEEADTGLDRVVNVYYPSSVQARGPDAPWEGELPRVAVTVDGRPVPAERVRFYGLAHLPRDVRQPSP